MKRIVITRNKWGMASLHRSDNHKRCCLGFACLAYGIDETPLENLGFPDNLPDNLQKKLPKWLRKANEVKDVRNNDVDLAAQINDDDALTLAEKEEKLKPIFKKHNIQLIFRGKVDG